MVIYYDCYKCPECGSERTRTLDCEQHCGECNLIICRDCGETIPDNITEDHGNCIECGIKKEIETDLQICEECCDKFDLDLLWKLHDENKVKALDFNESQGFRDQFRKAIRR